MSSVSQVPDSNLREDEVTKTPERKGPARETSAPVSALSHRFRDSPTQPKQSTECRAPAEDSIAVMVSGPARPWEYQPYNGDTTVDAILEEIEGPTEGPWYRIEYETGRQEDLSLDQLLNLSNGRNALHLYRNGGQEIMSRSEEDSQDVGSQDGDLVGSDNVGKYRSKRVRNRPVHKGFVDSYKTAFDSEEEVPDSHLTLKKRRLEVGSNSNSGSRRPSRAVSRTLRHDDSTDSDIVTGERSGIKSTRGGNIGPSTSGRITRSRTERSSGKSSSKAAPSMNEEVDELAGDFSSETEHSNIIYVKRKRKSRPVKEPPTSQSTSRRRRLRQGSSSESERPEPTRRSGRNQGAVKNLRERHSDDEIYADEVAKTNAPKIISIREIFQPLSKQSEFRMVHHNECDICSGTGAHSNKGISPLIYCQGCSTSIHKVCLGYRSTREHLVTKIGHEDFVMQCRRCIGLATKKDSSAPRLDVCQACNKKGPACASFSIRRTAKQEEKLREENGGNDPITNVAEELINDERNVLFRCAACHRGYHFEHLPPLSAKSKTPDDTRELQDERFNEYLHKWQCKECLEMASNSTKVQALVAWRPKDPESYSPGQISADFREDEREYLVKWEGKSHFKCTWMSGSWVWGITTVMMRKAFFNRDEGANALPRWTSEEAIPEEYLRMEIVLDVDYQKGFRPQSHKYDKQNVDRVNQVFVKFLGLTYEDAVWEDPPEPEDEDRWNDFVAAYDEYVIGRYFKQVPATVMKERADGFRAQEFEEEVELEKQPSALTGGQMMPYQMEGLNWLLWNFHQKKNVILADEMGLGKTIQIISLFASLIVDSPKCWPFLVVTPNSTCPNWRREIKKWAPGLRVVAYYGAKKSRDMAMQYELYPSGVSDMRAHIVVTSYEAPVDDHSKSFFRRIKWAGMIVDEGQRLKNDENLLYGALQALRTPFQVLLTGTPLQNNKRELFNLLQFLDPGINAVELDEKYAELTSENLPELHELIRPFFLRRTKLQVLKFLPPMAQVILPVTMSLVQKKLYKSILAKNPELIKSIFGQTKTVLRPTDRGNLNNILMQLRKCLCHPFLYSSAIEERSANEHDMLRGLIDASSKFQLLEIMLPKLKERGHRVLLFSQFLKQLDLVEDFLNGLGLSFQRLDGTISTLEKQKRIDAFNAPDSPLFAFLLSTRAGGVGINLATADTVIIMDPDFNPHQDIQALSRAHRIGQKKKVLVFQLMTKDTAEEKIVQIGRKKMALDQALIESMGAEDDAGIDLESILKHGAEALFNDDDENDIHYDSASVDKLLDRTQVENTSTDEGKSAESQFSFARVWANDKGTLTEELEADESTAAPNLSVWDKILKEREAEAALEAQKNLQTFGRGKRSRQNVDYHSSTIAADNDTYTLDPKIKGRRKKGLYNESASDRDFMSSGASADETDAVEEVDPQELEAPGSTQDRLRGILSTPTKDPLNHSSSDPNLRDLTLQHQPVIHRPNSVQQPGRFQLPGPGPHPTFPKPASQPQSAPRAMPPNYPPILPPNAPRYYHPGAPMPNHQSKAPSRNLLQRPDIISNGSGLDRQAPGPYPPGTLYHDVCRSPHVPGQCPLLQAPPHLAPGPTQRKPAPSPQPPPKPCESCHIVHSHFSRICPSIMSDAQIRRQLDNMRLDPDSETSLRDILRRILFTRAVRRQPKEG